MIRSDEPLLKHCENVLLEELAKIRISRMNRTISVYQVIETILQDPKVESVFCEGSFVMYAFNKLCRNHSEDRLVRPGDIDLHIDYHGSWYDFAGKKDVADVQARWKELADRKQEIQRERQAITRATGFEASQKHRTDEFEQITSQFQDLQNQDVQDITTPVGELLGLRSEDYEVKPFDSFKPPEVAEEPLTPAQSQWLKKASMRELLEGYGQGLQAESADAAHQQGMTIGIGSSAEFPLLHTGTMRWKAKPSLELTLINVDTDAEHRDMPGYVVENIPKFYFTTGPGGLRVTGENLYTSYTDISLGVSETGEASCKSLIKAYELYLRYIAIPSGKTYGEHTPIDPLRSASMFDGLECIRNIAANIDAWNAGAHGDGKLNEFICGILKKIGNKHASSYETIKKMLVLLKDSLYHLMQRNFGYTEADIKGKFDPYLIACMTQCLSVGIYLGLREIDGSSHFTTNAVSKVFGITDETQIDDLYKDIKSRIEESIQAEQSKEKQSKQAKGGRRTMRKNKSRKRTQRRHTGRKRKGKKRTKRHSAVCKKNKKNKTKYK